MIKNSIYKSELVEWRTIQDLQPELLKNNYNISHLRDSILKHGISKAFDVCELEGQIFFLDGHTRSNMFQTLESEGIELPKMIMCNFCEVESKSDAIQILLEVHNQRHNPINNEVLVEWLEVEEIEIEEINIGSINVEVVEGIEDKQHEKTVQELTNMIAISLTDEEQEIWLHTKEKLGIKKDKNVIFELIKLYSNEGIIN